MRATKRRKQTKKKDRPTEEEFNSLTPRERYWHRRYSLFSLFDLGVQLDDESFYSVTPEVLAEHHAARCAEKIVVDACCGVGGNTLQLAKVCDRVIAVDCDASKIEMGKANAEIYGVAHKIEWICGDFLALSKSGQLSKFNAQGIFVLLILVLFYLVLVCLCLRCFDVV
jgi:trimethylguanosine synthase